jgi:hypothetical protein
MNERLLTVAEASRRVPILTSPGIGRKGDPRKPQLVTGSSFPSGRCRTGQLEVIIERAEGSSIR